MKQHPDWRVVDWRGAAFSTWATNHDPSRDDQITMLAWLNDLERIGVWDTIAFSSDGFPMERGPCDTAIAYILEPRPLGLPEALESVLTPSERDQNDRCRSPRRGQ